MENELRVYSIGDTEIELPRQWVPIEDLRDITSELGYDSEKPLEQILKDSGIDTDSDLGKADFTGVNIFLLKKGLFSSEFLKTILDSNFDNDFIKSHELISLFYDFKIEENSDVTIEEARVVISALKDLAYC
jgi:hypothetical protein